MSAISEATFLLGMQLAQGPCEQFELGQILYQKLHDEVNAWCDKHDRVMLSNASIDRPNFLFRGVWVHP